MHLLRAGTTWQQEVRCDGVESRKQALDMLRARGAQPSAPGEWVYTLGGWAIEQFADDKQAVHARGAGSGRPEQSGVPAGVLLREAYLNSRGAAGDRHQTSAPTRGLPKDRSCATRPAGRPAASSKAGLPPASVAQDCRRRQRPELEASTLRDDQGPESRRASPRSAVAGCDADVLPMYRKWASAGQLNVRVFCIDGAGGRDAASRSISALPQIAQMKLFQGDDYIDNVFYGESVYGPLHDPMFVAEVRSEARAARAVAPHGDGDREGRPAAARARRADEHASTRSSIRSKRSTRSIRSRTCAGRWRTSTSSTRRTSSA